ncbi:hypothetical protein V3H18_12170 [Methylocystis sp. 9N]|uniref:Antitoxin FitA-like ribbon-helix-helix domain-containing protein n=1 Tax=Methylocystis borbori TaxID=3118750 RepID=A0ABU7XIT6_9HYPH
MTNILLRDVPPDLKRQIEELAQAHKTSLSSEIKALLERALRQSARFAEARSQGGLGTKLKSLVAEADWTDDFIRPRDKSERPAPNFE